MKLISWNVNGIRAAIKKGFEDFLKESNPDILCLQEVKANEDQVEWDINGYKAYWNSAEKKGYSGVAVLTKKEPLNITKGLGSEELDNEGRVLTLEYDSFYLLNVYTPNAKRDLARLDWKDNVWNPAFQEHLETLQKTKPVVFCGDLNVAHKEIDLANPKTNKKNAGFTPEERAGMDKLVDEAGFVDSLRHFNQEPGQYTWWSYRPGIRERNIGWRLDYFCVSQSIKEKMTAATILKDVMGSDHCPISLEINV
jgi:exodeoxyribonuclease III